MAKMAVGFVSAASLTVLLATAGLADQRPSVAALPSAAPLATVATPAAIEPQGLSRAEALERLQLEGFKTVTRLVRDSEGNWIGAARRGNRVVDVAVDHDGDVIAW